MLKKILKLADAAGGDESPFRRLGAERDRFVIEFSSDQWTDFRDRGGRLVRLRYVPLYRSRHYDLARGYGLLGPEPEVTPDLALELYSGPDDSVPPEMIVVLDAKYSSSAHGQLIERVRNKYGRIGVFATGTILSRQGLGAGAGGPALRAAVRPGVVAALHRGQPEFLGPTPSIRPARWQALWRPGRCCPSQRRWKRCCAGYCSAKAWCWWARTHSGRCRARIPLPESEIRQNPE